MKAKARRSEGRFAYEGLDRVIHERARLSVLTSLMTNAKGLTFNDLKELCALTDGNLSRHLRVLETGKDGGDCEGTRPEPAADDLPDYGFGAEELSRVPDDFGTGDPGCGESEG